MLLSVCYFPYKDHHLAHIVFRSCFVYVGDNRMKRAVIRMAFSTAGEDTNRFPQVRSVSPATHLSSPTPQTANGPDEVRNSDNLVQRRGEKVFKCRSGARGNDPRQRSTSGPSKGSQKHEPRYLDHQRRQSPEGGDPQSISRVVGGELQLVIPDASRGDP